MLRKIVLSCNDITPVTV